MLGEPTSISPFPFQNVFQYEYPRSAQTFWVHLHRTWQVYAYFSDHYCAKYTEKYVLAQWLASMLSCLNTTFLLTRDCQTSSVPAMQAAPPSYPVECPRKNSGLRQRTQKMLHRPFGQECIYLSYPPVLQSSMAQCSVKLNLKSVPLTHLFGGHGIYYFNTVQHFGANITFVKFLLSGFCLGSGLIRCNKFNEFLWIYVTKPHNMFYCRSQWSVYLKYKLKIFFNPCSIVCHGRTTSFVFNYQIIDTKFLETTTDCFHKTRDVERSDFHFGSTKITSIGTKKLSLAQIFVTAQKYEHIFLTTENISQIYFHSQVHVSLKHLQHEILVHVHFLHCFFSKLESDLSAPLPTKIKYTFSMMKCREFAISEDKTFQLHGSVEGNSTFFQTATKLSVDSGKFAKLTFNNFSQFGFYSCFYGALSVFEGSDLTQIYQVCNQNPNNAPKGFVLSAASNETLVVAHLAINGSITVSLFVETTKCQGIFVNTCTWKSFPLRCATVEHYKTGHTKSSIPEIMSQFPPSFTDQDQCATFQIGAQYIPQKERFPLQDCKFVFRFTKNPNSACTYQMTLDYTKFYGKDYLFFTTKDRWANQHEVEAFLGMSHPTKSSVLLGKSFHCDDDFLRPRYFFLSNIVFPGQEAELFQMKSIFNYWFRVPYNRDRRLLENEHPLTYFVWHSEFLLEQGSRKFHDVLYIKEAELSYHKRLLTVTYKSCKSFASSLGNQLAMISTATFVCLKKDIRQYIYPNMTLSLVTEQIERRHCFWGSLNLSVYLCVQDQAYVKMSRRLPLNYNFLGLKICVPLFTCMGQCKLEWISPLTNAMFLTGKGMVQVNLPGKISLASLDLSNQSCCQNKTCSLKYVWLQGKEPKPQANSLDENRHQWIARVVADLTSGNKYVLKSVEVGMYGQPDRKIKRSWLHAKEICLSGGSFLPSFLSDSEVTAFVEYVKKLSAQLLISTIFVGLVIQVMTTWPCFSFLARYHSLHWLVCPYRVKQNAMKLMFVFGNRLGSTEPKIS